MIVVAGCLSVSVNAQEATDDAARQSTVPTQAEAAIIFSRELGMFDRYVAWDASRSECVTFLNRQGVYFGLLEVTRGGDFTLHDCARVMGQLSLLFSGEAEYLAGKVKLPKGIDSWEEFCILNDVKYVQGFESLVQMVDLYRVQ